MTLKNGERNLCILFSFVFVISVIWSLLNIIISPSSVIEPNAINSLDKLVLSALIVGLLFFFGYARYLLNKTLFLRKIFSYLGWWFLLLIAKEFIVLLPYKTMRIFLVTFIFLLGLYLLTLAFLNLKKLLEDRV